MLRARRCRAVLIFAVVFVLVFVHFVRSRDWERILPLDHRHDLHFQSQSPPVDPLDFPPPPRPQPPVLEQPVFGDDDDDEAGVGVGVQDQEQQAQSQSQTGQDDGGRKGKPEGKTYKPGKPRVNLFPQTSYKELPRWKKTPEQFPLAPEELIKLPAGKPKELPRLQAKFKAELEDERRTRLKRLAVIKEAFEHAWAGYKASAMGHDELVPMRGGWKDSFNGWGATLVDALDTLWIMDMKEEFDIAVDQIKEIDFTTSERSDIPLFETVIRYLGGLMGAYDVSRHQYPVLLEKARELAEILIGAFDTPNRMPTLYYLWAPEFASKTHRSSRQAILAEIGSLTVEFTRLAQLTNESQYYDAIARITNELEAIQMSTRLPGLWPSKLDATGCERPQPAHYSGHFERGLASNVSTIPVPKQSARPVPTDIRSYKHFLDQRDEGGHTKDSEPANYNQMDEKRPGTHEIPPQHDCHPIQGKGLFKETFSMGAEADSMYEYLPKEYMLLGGLNEQYKTMYEKAMATTREHLLFQPMVKHGRNMRFMATLDIKKSFSMSQPDPVSSKYEGTHLACFTGGMFAIGARLFGIKGDMDIAANLTDGCVWAYESTYTGIMPESFLMVPCKKNVSPCVWDENRYKDALDPYRADRIATEKILAEEQKSKQAKTDGVQGYQTSTPVPFARHRNGILIAGHEHDPAAPPTDHKVNIKARGPMEPAPGEALTSSDDYIKARIQDERLPPGFVRLTNRNYLLRPEAIESVFVMYRLTGNEHWREKGWKMFEGVSKHTRTNMAHSSIDDVTSMEPHFQDSMESFWLAETLKYFYLLFSDPGVVSLDEYVL